jgi:hypothetical protein
MKRYSLGDYPYKLAEYIVWSTIEIFTGYSKETFEKLKDEIKRAVYRRIFRAETYIDDLESGILGIENVTLKDLGKNEIVWQAYIYASIILGYEDWREAVKYPLKLFPCMRAILIEVRNEVEKAWRKAEGEMKKMKLSRVI